MGSNPSFAMLLIQFLHLQSGEAACYQGCPGDGIM